MSQEHGSLEKRFDVNYFEGCNSLVSHHVSDRHEFSHMENARCIEIGTIQKREGQTVLGTAVGGGIFVTQHNYGLLYFEVDNVTNQGLYRLSEVSTPGKATLFYLNELGTVTATNLLFGGTGYSSGAGLTTIGGSGTNCTIDIVAVSGSITTITIATAGTGYRNGEILTVVGGDNNATFEITTPNEWVPLAGKGANINAGDMSHTTEGENMFISNYYDFNRYLEEDGVTVLDSFDANGHLWNSPKAKKVNYYKNRLYLANFIQDKGTGLSGVVLAPGTGYTTSGATPTTGGHGTGLTVSFTAVAGAVTAVVVVAPGTGYYSGDIITVTTGGANATFTLTTNTTKYKTTILRSSFPLGIIALANVDNPSDPSKTTPELIPTYSPPTPLQYNSAGLTGSCRLEVTDNKYFYVSPGPNTCEVYRGGNKIADITVTKVNETSIDVSYTFVAGTTVTTFQAADEIWVTGTFTGKKIFRWVNNASITGRDLKQYDTFKLSGGDNDEITIMTNIGNIMIVGNRFGLATWNDYVLENFDVGVGCVSHRGYVKLTGSLYFLDYTGIYSTSGNVPQLISSKVQKYITGATKSGKDACVAGKKGRSIFFTLGDVTLYNPDRSVDKILNDVCLEYHLTSQNWYVHSNVKASDFATFIEYYNPDRLVLLSTADNKSAKEFLRGNTDDGEEIFMRLDLNRMTFQDQYENNNTLNSLIVESERGSALKCFVSIAEENNEWYMLEGAIEKGISILKISPKDGDRGEPTPCRLLNVSLRDSSKQTPKLTRLAVTYTPGSNPAIVE